MNLENNILLDIHERLGRDHAELDEMLTRLKLALEANDATRSHGTLDLFWARLAMHIRAEHLHLFPAISRAASRGQTSREADVLPLGEPQQTIDALRHDHDFFMHELSRAVAITRDVRANPEGDVAEQLREVRQIIAEVRERLAKHNEIEEKGIYLWAGKFLSDAERSALAVDVNRELENMPPRFENATNQSSA